MSPSPLDLPNTGGLHGALFVLHLAIGLALTLVVALHTLRLRRLPGVHWPLLDAWHDLALGTDPKQVTLILRFMVGAINATMGIMALNYGASEGVIDSRGCFWLTVASLLTVTGLYGTLRSGLNRRLSDPSMAEIQLVACEAMLAWGYVIGGVGRPIALLLLFIFLLFSMFTATMRGLIRASVFAAIFFGIAMAYVSMTEPVMPGLDIAYGVIKLQLVYFCVMLAMLASICLMVNFLTQLRAKSSRRKAELAEALARIQDLATRDELTGLFNRRHMLELLNNEKQRCIRAERAFCVALIDVDHFKYVNDTHGHGVGDEVLASVAEVISGSLRETDVVARWGGEEFLIMFTDTDGRSAELVLSRMQLMLASSQVSSQAPDLHITFSAGLTRYDAEELLTRTIDRADRALYMAKAAGRNRVVRFDAGDAVPHVTTAPQGANSVPRRSGALENRHAFDMRGVGEHVHRPA